MSREPVEAKGRRYLGEGRLTVTRVDEDAVEATCRGGGAVYELGHDGEHWWCGCPARGRCAHLVALGLVVVRDSPAEGEEDPEPMVTRPASGPAVEDDEEHEPDVGGWL